MWSEITSPICTGGFGRTASLQDACLASCTARLSPSRASQLLGAKRGVIPDHILRSGQRASEGTLLHGDFEMDRHRESRNWPANWLLVTNRKVLRIATLITTPWPPFAGASLMNSRDFFCKC